MRLRETDELGDFLEKASWHSSGIELDITDMGEDEYREMALELEKGSLPVRSLHYGRTENVSMQEWELFESQLEKVKERAEKLGCQVISVAPPRAEVNESHTVKDLQDFMEEADSYARSADLELCFLMDGFMKDPEMVNTAFRDLDSPSIGVMVDLSRIVDGLDPVTLLQKMDVQVRKIILPVPLEEIGEHLGEMDDEIMVVAERI